MNKLRTSLLATTVTLCAIATGHSQAATDPAPILEYTSSIDYLAQARVGNTRLLTWTSGKGTVAAHLMGAFVDATNHTLIGAPFELAKRGDTFTCAAGATCEISNLSSSAPTVHGNDDSGQFLVAWTFRIKPDMGSTKPYTNDVTTRIIRINADGSPDLQPLTRVSYIDNDQLAEYQASSASAYNGVAFNPSKDEYLITWMGRHLGETHDQPYAALLDKNGALVSTGGKIYNGMTESHVTAMSAAFNADADEYLVTMPSAFSDAGNATLIGAALSATGTLEHVMQTIEPFYPGFAGNSALLPLSAERTLVFYENGSKRQVTALWLDMSGTTFGPTAAGHIDVASADAIDTLAHPEILHMPGQDAAVLVYTDNSSDGDGVKSTGELRYRTIDLAAPTDQQPQMGSIRIAAALTGDAVEDHTLSNRTVADAIDSTHFVTFFVDESNPKEIVALEHDLARNELGVTAGADQPVTGGEVASVSFTLENRGNSDEIDAFKTLPEAGTTLQLAVGSGLEITSATGCALQPATLQCVVSDSIMVGTAHKVTFTVGTPVTDTEKKAEVSASIISEVDGKDPANNTAVGSVVMKTAETDPNDPNDPNNPAGPTEPPGSSGGGSLGWLVLLMPVILRRRLARS